MSVQVCMCACVCAGISVVSSVCVWCNEKGVDCVYAGCNVLVVL